MWQQLATGEIGQIVILSPYLTGLATKVLEAVPQEAAAVYTLFDAELFLSGGSSLETLRWIVQRNHALFMLPKLHAKIVLIPGLLASIGSQNMTTGGQHNNTKRPRPSSQCRRAPHAFRKLMIEAMVNPFLYQDSFAGKEADDFFWGDVDSKHELRVMKFHGHPILVAEAWM